MLSLQAFTDWHNHTFPRKKRHQFDCTMSQINGLLELAAHDTEKLQILDYAIDSICKELCCSVTTEILYNHKESRSNRFLIPLWSFTSHKRNLSLVGINVLSDTYDTEKLQKAVHHVYTDGFTQIDYYCGIFYPEINLAIIDNGIHHLSAAASRNEGSAELHICHLSEAFPVMRTDGAYWYIDGKSPEPVLESRIAILYEIARIKHELFPSK